LKGACSLLFVFDILTLYVQMPAIEFRCSARASQFAYVPAMESAKAKETSKVETAVLSYTNRVRKEKERRERHATGADGKPVRVVVLDFLFILQSHLFSGNTRGRGQNR
jgi:hypothetical protein